MAIQISGTTVIDNSRNVNAGIGTFTALNVPPIPITFSPADSATGVAVASNIVITFNETIAQRTGNITFRSGSAGGTAFSTIGVTSTSVSISGGVATINPPADLPFITDVFVVVDAGSFSGLSTTSVNNLINTYNFTTINHLVNSITPTNAATSVVVSTNITLAFPSVPVRGTGTITLRSGSSTGTIIESFDAASSGRISVSGSNWILDPTADLAFGTEIFLVIPNTAIVGYLGLNVAGADVYSFTTITLTVNSITPANGSTNRLTSTNITLAFSSPPVRGTGTITLRRDNSGGTILESFDAASSGRISVSGSNWILDPTSRLPYCTSIFLIIPATAIQSYLGLNVAGADVYSFTTEVDASLGASYEGGFLICKSDPIRFVVSPCSAEVLRNWYARNDANTRSQIVSGCTGWFVPTIGQLQNPGFVCRSFWGPSPCFTTSPAFHWSNDECIYEPYVRTAAKMMDMTTGPPSVQNNLKNYPRSVRAFRCVTY